MHVRVWPNFMHEELVTSLSDNHAVRVLSLCSRPGKGPHLQLCSFWGGTLAACPAWRRTQAHSPQRGAAIQAPCTCSGAITEPQQPGRPAHTAPTA